MENATYLQKCKIFDINKYLRKWKSISILVPARWKCQTPIDHYPFGRREFQPVIRKIANNRVWIRHDNQQVLHRRTYSPEAILYTYLNLLIILLLSDGYDIEQQLRWADDMSLKFISLSSITTLLFLLILKGVYTQLHIFFWWLLYFNYIYISFLAKQLNNKG